VFHIAAHQFVLAEFSAGRLTVAEIKEFAGANRISLPAEERVLPSVPFPASEKSGRRGDRSGASAERSVGTEHAFVPHRRNLRAVLGPNPAQLSRDCGVVVGDRQV
jgi:hypothetical protein